MPTFESLIVMPSPPEAVMVMVPFAWFWTEPTSLLAVMLMPAVVAEIVASLETAPLTVVPTRAMPVVAFWILAPVPSLETEASLEPVA